MDRGTARHRAVEAHRNRWGEPRFVVRAPGRVNLIGEHTDYNDGFVLPMALPFETALAVTEAPDGGITVDSEGFGRVVLAGPVTAPPAWSASLRGVVHLLAEADVPVRPARITVASDIPAGASLSSSAAIEVALTMAILHLADRSWSAVEIARLGQRVENDVLGLPSGIMDQLISASAVAGHASLIDCRSLDIWPHPLPSSARVVVIDTGTRRRLVDSEFARRRAECALAARALGVDALRDADDDLVSRLAPGSVERRRASHVVSENRRTLAAAQAMTRDDATTLGTLMHESHRSLRDDYEVSGPALDRAVDIAVSAPGCLGARMTGGGFAGCAVALVDAAVVDAFRDEVEARLGDAGGVEPVRTWACAAHGGASIGPPR